MSYYRDNGANLFVKFLTREQEYSLIKRWKRGDSKAKKALVENHLAFVVKIALRTNKGILSDEDAISVGNVALMHAVNCRRFDTRRGYRFSTYLRRYIVGEVKEAIRQHIQSKVQVPTVPLNSLDNDEEMLVNAVEIPSWALMYVAPEPDVAAATKDTERLRKLLFKRAMRRLSKQERSIVQSVAIEGKTFREAGAVFGMTRQAAQQGYVKALLKLKHKLQKYKDLII
jgi:RNA polymerase sigma factor (sigma-70 family)